MTRIVIHAGFHKTGTTSVQSLIHANRRRLGRRLRCYLKPDFIALTEAARSFSVDPDAMRLTELTEAAQAFFDTLDPEDPRDVLMSSEDLSGHMPGRHGLDRYDAAELIMPQIADAARQRFGEPCEITFFFSTRAADRWLRSAWWQNLRSTRITLDLDTYATRYREAAEFDTVLQAIADTVAPARVTALPLEASTALPHGPLTPLLDLLDIPDAMRTRLHDLPPENVQPDQGLPEVFLALNRSGLKERHIKEVKRTLRQMAERNIVEP